MQGDVIDRCVCVCTHTGVNIYKCGGVKNRCVMVCVGGGVSINHIKGVVV